MELPVWGGLRYGIDCGVCNVEPIGKKMDVLGRKENTASALVSEVEDENPGTEDHGNT